MNKGGYSMLAKERLEIERLFHNQQALQRAIDFDRGTASLVFDDDYYLDHETWIRPAFNHLGDVRGKKILDYGCGHGMASVVMARRGADVVAIDLSDHYVEETLRRAESNRVAVHAQQSNAEALPFESQTFDAVWGCAILHHLDLKKAASEIKRVLKPGGAGVFCEPWGENPLLDFARRNLPYPGKHRTIDEHPFTHKDLSLLRGIFPDLNVEGHQLFGMLRRILGACWLSDKLTHLDTHLLQHWSGLQRWCRYVVVVLPKSG
jgi:SAM-dependent methyltransferase